MKRAIAVLLVSMLFIPFGGAQVGQSTIFRGTDAEGKPSSLRIFQLPCENANVLKHLAAAKVTPDWLLKFQSAILYWKDRHWASYWVAVSETVRYKDGREENVEIVYSMDEEGSQFQPIDKRRFRSEGT